MTIIGADRQPVAKVGDTGEIAIRRDSPVVMKEYWKNPDAMEEKFAGEWCLTGDLGYADDEGYVYFQGRADDVIKTSGYRVGPAEVEASIMEVKGVASCAVIGVPDEQRGQSIKAFVKVLPSIDKVRPPHHRRFSRTSRRSSPRTNIRARSSSSTNSR